MIKKCKTTTTNGELVYFCTDNESKKLILYLHGAFGAPDPIRALSEHFKDYKIIAPYLPGHGDSFSLTANSNIEIILESLKEFLDTLEYESIILVGHSFGGLISLYLKDFKDFDKVVLINPVIFPVSDHFLKSSLNTISDFVSDMKHNKKSKIKKGGYKIPRLDSMKYIWKLVTSKETFSKPLNFTNSIILLGKADKVIKNQQGKEFSDCNVKVFEGGHYFHFRKSNKFLEELEKIIS